MPASTNVDTASAPLLVVLGLDSGGKPHASRFATEHATVALRAAALMKFRAVNIGEEELVRAARDLPEGKIFATGRGLVPFVKRDLYDRFAPLLGTEAEQVLPTIEAPAETQHVQIPDQVDDQTSPWALLKVGSTVLAPDPAEGGWYEAIVLSVSDDSKSLTVGWRDFPREAKLTIGRYGVGVVFKA